MQFRAPPTSGKAPEEDDCISCQATSCKEEGRLALDRASVEGSEEKRKMVRMVRRLALTVVLRGIDRVVFLADSSPTAKRGFFAIPFGQRGQPIVKTQKARRDPAMCNLPAAMFCGPQPSIGQRNGYQVTIPYTHSPAGCVAHVCSDV